MKYFTFSLIKNIALVIMLFCFNNTLAKDAPPIVRLSTISNQDNIILPNTVNNLLYTLKIDIDGIGNDVSSSSISFKTEGTYLANDINTFKVFKGSSSVLNTGTLLGTFQGSILGAGENISIPINTNTPGGEPEIFYIYITADVNINPTIGSIIKINGALNPVSIAFSTNRPEGLDLFNNQSDIAGLKTIAIPAQLEPLSLLITSQTNIDCHGNNNGTVGLTASGGDGTYTISPSQTGLTAGSHTFTVIDGTGATATLEVTITQPNSALNVAALPFNLQPSLCNKGATNVMATGGIPPYTISSTDNSIYFENSIGIAQNGIYPIKVTDSKGCIFERPLQISNSLIPSTISFTGGATSINQNAFDGVYTTNWNVNLPIIISISPSNAGTVSLTSNASGVVAIIDWDEAFSGNAIIKADGYNDCAYGELQVTISPTTTSTESQNPIAIYPLNGDANDTSGNNFHGTISGNPSFVAGVQGQALHTISSTEQFVTVPNNTQFDNITKVTLATWVKPQMANLACWLDREMLIGKGQDEIPNGYAITIQRNVDNPNCNSADAFINYKFNFEYGGKSVSTPFYPVDNKWRYVTGTYDNNTLKIYVDGQLVAEQTEGLLDSKSTYPMYFNHGTYWNGNSSGSRFGGDLDNIRVYNRAISATEVMDIYNAEKPSIVAPIMAAATMTSNANSLFCAGGTLIFTVDNPDEANYVIKDPAGQIVNNLTIANAFMAGPYTIESFNTVSGLSIEIFTLNVNIFPSTTITFISGATTLKQNAPNETYTPSLSGAHLSLSPAEAGTIDIQTGVVDWNENFFGTATISAQMPPCANGSMQVTVNQETEVALQKATMTSNDNFYCHGETITLIVTNPDPTRVSYIIKNPENNVITDLVIPNSTMFNSGIYTIESFNIATQVSIGVQSITINVNPIVPIDFISGATTLTQNAGNETYAVSTTEPVVYFISPENAGVISNSGIVDWNANFYGTATINVNSLIGPFCGLGHIIVTVNQVNTPLIAITLATKTYCTKNNLELTVSANGGQPLYSYAWTGPNGFSSTENNPVITYVEGNPSPAGTYTVTISDGGGATATASIVVSEIKFNITPEPVCSRATGGIVNLSVENGSGNYTFSKNGVVIEGTSTHIINDNYPGTVWDPMNPGSIPAPGAPTGPIPINLQVTDNVNACQITVPYILPGVPEFRSTIAVNKPYFNGYQYGYYFCEGEEAVLTPNVIGGYGDKTYSWSGPNNYLSSNQNGIVPNLTKTNTTHHIDYQTYTLTVTDNIGCTTTRDETIRVGENETLIFTEGATTLFKNSPDGKYRIQLPLINYYPSFTITPLEAGTITQGIYDQSLSAIVNWSEDFVGVAKIKAFVTGNLCINGEIDVIINDAPFTVNTIPTKIYCPETDLAFSATTYGGTSPIIYSWTGPNGFISNIPNPVITYATNNPSPIGTYTVLVTDGTGTTSSATVIVSNPTPIIFTAGSISINQDAAQGMYITNVPINENVLFTITPTEAGTISQTPTAGGVAGNIDWNANFFGVATIKAQKENSCSFGEIQITVNEATFKATTIGSQTLCPKSNLNLTVSTVGGTGTLTYAWTGPNNFTSAEQNPVIEFLGTNPDLAGTYLVTITDESLATAKASIEVVNAQIIQFYSGPTTVIQNSPNSTYYTNNSVPWIDGITTYSISPSNAGNLIEIYDTGIIVDWNDEFNGVATLSTKNLGANCSAGEIQINVTPLPLTALAVPPTYCKNSNLELKVTSTGGVGGNTYSWTGPNNFTSSDQYPIIIFAEVNPSPAGTYMVTVTDGAMSTATATFVVTESSNPQLTLSAKHNPCIPVGSEILLTATGGTGNYTFTTNNGFVSGNKAFPADFALTNNLSVVDSEGCKAEISYNLPAPYLNLVVGSIETNSSLVNKFCVGDNANLLTRVFAGNVGYSYQWTGPNDFTSAGESVEYGAKLDLLNLNLQSAGSYELKVTDGEGCTQIAQITLVVDEKIQLNFISGAESIIQNAPNETYTTDASAGTILSYTLLPIDAGTILNNGEVDWNESYLGTATIKVSSPNSCVFGEKQVMISPPILTATTENQKVFCAKSNLELKVSTSGGSGGNIFNWTGPNNFISSEQNPVITFLEGNPSPIGNYTLIVTDATGASASATIAVIANTFPELMLTAAVVPSSECDADYNGLVTLSASGGAGNYLYSVSGNYNSIDGNIASVVNPYVQNEYIVVDGVGCIAKINYGIEYASRPFNAGIFTGRTFISGSNIYYNYQGNGISETICENGQINLYPYTNDQNIDNTFYWTGPNGFASSASSLSFSNLNTNQSGIYELTVSNRFGCSSITKLFTLNIISIPQIGISHGQSILPQNAPNEIYSTDAPQGSVLSYSISPSSAGSISETGVVDWDENFYGEVTISVTYINGNCQSTASKLVTIKQNLIATIGTITQSNCGGPDVGAVEIVPAGGTAPYVITPAQTGLSVGSHTFLVTDADMNTKEVFVEIPNETIGIRWIQDTNSYQYIQKSICKKQDNENIVYFDSPLLVLGNYEIEYRLNKYQGQVNTQTVEIANLIVDTAGSGKFIFSPVTDNTGHLITIISIKIGNCKYPVSQNSFVALQTPRVPNITSCPATQTIYTLPNANTATLNFNWYVYNLLNNGGIQYAHDYSVTGATNQTGLGDGRPTYQNGLETPTINFNPGLSHYTITTNDGCNPPETCTFDVQVLQDLSIPIITCPSNIVLPTDEGQQTAIVNYALPIATDDNGTPQVLQTAGLPSGSIFPIGETILTYSATDASGNSANCTFSIIVYERSLPLVEDTTIPVTLPPGTSEITLPSGTYQVTVPEGGSVVALLILNFPTGAGTITINGVTYGPPVTGNSANKLGRSAIIPFPPEGVSVPTDAFGVPTVPIVVSPLEQNESSIVVIDYVAVNEQNKTSPIVASITVQFELPLVATVTKVNNITCFGVNNGSVEITVNGGNSPYSFDKSLNSLSPGLHQFIITDNNANTTTATAVVNEPSMALQLSFSEKATQCNGNLASAKLNISGGTSPYNIVSVENGATVMNGYISGLAGTYNLTISDANGCQTQNEITFTACIETDVICTITQNGYANATNVACTETGSSILVGTLMANALGGVNRIFGTQTNNRTFTLAPIDLSINIFNMLSGVSTASSKFGLGGTSYSTSSTWARVPLTNVGKLANTLFAHSMSLYFNLQNSTKLGNVALTSPLLHTESTLNCGSGIGSGIISSYQLPTAVVNFLNTNSMGYPATVAGLFQLNNDALGGKTGLPNLSTLAASADKVNKAFNGCKLLALQPANTLTFGTNIRVKDSGNAFNAPAKGGLYMTLIEGEAASGHILGVVEVGSDGATGFAPVINNGYQVVMGTDPEGSRVPQAPSGYRIVSQLVRELGTSNFGGDETTAGTGQITIGNFNPKANARLAAGSTFEIEFTLEPLSGPLPVRLISFEGKAVETGNKLIWITSSEQNFSHYEIERSLEAKTFDRIGKVLGTNKSKENLTYDFFDNLSVSGMVPGANTFNLATPIGYYYRLKMIDLDGKFNYSNIIYLQKDNDKSKVGEFYPNPVAGGQVNIQIYSKEMETWFINSYDETGKVLMSEVWPLNKGINNIKIDSNKLAPGLNIIQFVNSNGKVFRKLVKK